MQHWLTRTPTFPVVHQLVAVPLRPFAYDPCRCARQVALVIQKAPQLAAPARVLQFLQRLGLDLADAPAEFYSSVSNSSRDISQSRRKSW
jgi:hypothetical protein